MYLETPTHARRRGFAFKDEAPKADCDEKPYYSSEVWRQLRLSSKNHCDSLA